MLPRWCWANDERGFTLLELLIAITLLGMLMTALFGGLRLGVRVWDRSDQALDAIGEAQAVRGFLRSRFEQVLPVPIARDGRQERLLFEGRAQGLRFVSSMPQSLGAGPFLIELTQQQRSSGSVRDLILTWRPLDPPDDIEREGNDGRSLIEDIVLVRFDYFGAKGEGSAPAWHQMWQEEDLLPSRIRIDLRFQSGDRRRWVPLIVSPMVDGWYDAAS